MAKLINRNVQHFCNDKEGIMSLYAVGKKDYQGEKPIIFIRGHAGKWTVNTKKFLDNAPKNFRLVKQHEGFWFDESVHYPFIAEYSYKDNMERGIQQYDKSALTTGKFATSTVEILEKKDLKEVDIIGASEGANVAMLMSTSDRVDRVSVVAPIMPYTFFADMDYLLLSKNKCLISKLLYYISKIYLDQEYGFVKDMNYAFRDAEVVKNLIDSSKIFIDAGKVDRIQYDSIDHLIGSIFMLISSYPIRKETGLYSDGAIVNDPSYFEKLGVQYQMNNDTYHIYCDQKEYILKRAYNNLSKINQSCK